MGKELCPKNKKEVSEPGPGYEGRVELEESRRKGMYLTRAQMCFMLYVAHL